MMICVLVVYPVSSPSVRVYDMATMPIASRCDMAGTKKSLFDVSAMFYHGISTSDICRPGIDS